MSHVAAIEIQVKDLDALELGGGRLGMELLRNVTQHKWWGHHVGDYPLPKGFTAADMGHCDHVLRIKGNTKAYEIGVCKRRDGKAGYTLLWDFYGGAGQELERVIGHNGKKLTQEYARAVAVKNAQRQGFSIRETKKQDGSYVLHLTK